MKTGVKMGRFTIISKLFTIARDQRERGRRGEGEEERRGASWRSVQGRN